MKTVGILLLTGLVIISSTLLGQIKAGMTFTSASDLAKAKMKYSSPSDKDKQEISNIISGSTRAYLEGDVEAILTFYSDQAVELYPNQMANAGTGNIRNRLKRQFTHGGFTRMDRTVESIEGAGPIALTWGKTKSAYKSGSDAALYEDDRHDIFLLRKQEHGQWKILVHHWLSDELPSGDPADDSVNIRRLLNKWSFFIKPGEVLSQEHLENYVANYSPQAVEILPNQWSNFGIANIRLRNAGAIGVTCAQGSEYSFDLNSFATIGADGFSKRAVAWGIGDHSNYGNGSDKVSQFLFPWAMILTKENDGQWRILTYHFYLE